LGAGSRQFESGRPDHYIIIRLLVPKKQSQYTQLAEI
jgi:hypothetical protein